MVPSIMASRPGPEAAKHACEISSHPYREIRSVARSCGSVH